MKANSLLLPLLCATSVSTADNRSNVLQLLMDAYRRKRDYERWLVYATELAGHGSNAIIGKLEEYEKHPSAYADGQSFTAYINAMRLRDAVHLLREKPEMSISSVAESVGFTPATFREQFKHQFGMTPTEYRQNL